MKYVARLLMEIDRWSHRLLDRRTVPGRLGYRFCCWACDLSVKHDRESWR